MHSKSSQNIFCEIPCLTEQSSFLSGLELQKKWFKASDKRYLAEALQKFTGYNRDLLLFLGVTPIIMGHDRDVGLAFRTGPYVGTIPLRAPDTGKQIGDFVVVPRYVPKRDKFGDYIQILNLLNHKIEPNFVDSIPLASGRNFLPPLYYEALLYVKELVSFTKRAWHRFKSVEEIKGQPSSQINWKRYVEYNYDPKRRLDFPSYLNILNESHSEYQHLKYVYWLAKADILSRETPFRIKSAALGAISYLDERLFDIPVTKTRAIQMRLSDPPSVKSIKVAANRILQKNVQQGIAWRVDFAEVFERLVQYIFRLVSREIGGVLFENVKFRTHGEHLPVWTLGHLEPDAVLRKDNLLFFIDAKYKSHLLNRDSESEYLKEEHRHDLHQAIAYSSFDTSEKKHVFLVYPAFSPSLEFIDFYSPLNGGVIKVGIVGVPLDVSNAVAVKNLIHQEIISNMY
jgi:hypothetical protein